MAGQLAERKLSGLSDGDAYMTIKPAIGWVTVRRNGETLAESAAAVVLRERGYPPTYYFPTGDVRQDLLSPSDHKSHCPHKGHANYWDVAIDGKRTENAVWAYTDPYPDAGRIKHLKCFDLAKLGAVIERDIEDVEEGDGRIAQTNPLSAWLLGSAWQASSEGELLRSLVEHLNDHDYSLMRANAVFRTLHPLIRARGHRWQRETGEVDNFDARHQIVNDPGYQSSPFPAIQAGEGGTRVRIKPGQTEFPYPIVEELAGQGATDYVAMPIHFSDGKINALTLASDRPGGLTSDQLGNIYEILPMIGRLFENHAKHRNTEALLETFLGRHTGRRVLEGSVQRGDGEEIEAVIWFCDLRHSTPLAEKLTRLQFLQHLNTFFDGTAGAVAEHGGEVLRFVGDAVLAIFPVESSDGARAGITHCPIKASHQAVEAVKTATERLGEVQRELDAKGGPPLDYGIGLHLGTVTYGNIGIPDRLEFTVIGSAANKAARVESMTKELDVPVAMSSDFVKAWGGDAKSLGEFSLRGVGQPEEIFTLPDFS